MWTDPLRSFGSAHIVLLLLPLSCNWPLNDMNRYSLGFIATLLSLLCRAAFRIANREEKRGHELVVLHSILFEAGQQQKVRMWRIKIGLYFTKVFFCCMLLPPLHSYFIWNRQDFLTCQMLYVSTINFRVFFALDLLYRLVGRAH